MNLLVVIGIAVGLAMDAFAVAVGTSVSLGRVSGRQVFRFGFHFGLFQAGMPLLGWLAGRGVQGYIAGWDHWVAFGLLAFIGGKAIADALRRDRAAAPSAESSSECAPDDRASVVGRAPPCPPQPRSGGRDASRTDSGAPPALRRAADLRSPSGRPPYIPEAPRSGPARAPDPTRGLTLLMLSVATSIDALAVGLSLGMLRVAIWYPALIIGLVTAALTIVGMRLGSRLATLLGARFSRVTEIVGGLVLIGIGVKILLQHVG
jgi:putative Mn2+ efflux pump MntP